MSRGGRRAVALLTSTLVCGALAPAALAAPAPAAASAAPVEVVVRADSVAAARAAVLGAGGTVARELGIIGGVAARLPGDRLAQLRRSSGVRAVTPDAAVRLLGQPAAGSTSGLGYDAVGNVGSMYNTAALIGAHDSYKAGYTGKGIDVAVLDSGVVPVQGLTSGNVVNGPDLSFESQDPATTNLDTFGHGTHMAGIIAGREVAQASPAAYVDATRFVGIAPDARVISLKLASHDGAVDVSQVIAAIDWVSRHKQEGGMKIRVLNLSFGTDSTQDRRLDPLSYAAEQAVRRGLVVVAAAGNEGTNKVELADPASNPHVIAVGAMDTVGTVKTSDDTLATFSNRGTSQRKVDVIAPGTKIIGLRAPGSGLDEAHPAGRVGSRFFRGSGSSQAAAVTSGAVALLLQRYPDLNPYQVKEMLGRTAKVLTGQQPNAGKGLIQVRAAQLASPVSVQVKDELGTGTGSLELARGTSHVADCQDTNGDGIPECVDLVGEKDVHGKAWRGADWAPKAANGTAWEGGGSWNGTLWTGTGFTGTSWASLTWAGRSWSGTSWSGRSWSGRSWSGRSWSGTSWSGTSWAGTSWSGRSWSGTSWAGAGWA